MFTVYVLFSESSDRFYIGFTNDIDRRLSEHNRKKGKFTDAGIPWKIVYTEIFTNKKDAREREKFLKSRKSKNFIRDLVSK